MPVQAQEIQVEPSTLDLEVGETAQLRGRVLDEDGAVRQEDRVVFYSHSCQALEVSPDGRHLIVSYKTDGSTGISRPGRSVCAFPTRTALRSHRTAAVPS